MKMILVLQQVYECLDQLYMMYVKCLDGWIEWKWTGLRISISHSWNLNFETMEEMRENKY